MKPWEEITVGGFSLAMFDEAFTKLGHGKKTSTCMGFMKDIGLQVIAAAQMINGFAVMAATWTPLSALWLVKVCGFPLT